jgi:hypothetical protein
MATAKVNKAPRKRARKEPLNDLATLQRAATKATRAAKQRAKDAGGYITYIKNGQLLRRGFDGEEPVVLQVLEEKPAIQSLEALMSRA